MYSVVAVKIKVPKNNRKTDHNQLFIELGLKNVKKITIKSTVVGARPCLFAIVRHSLY